MDRNRHEKVKFKESMRSALTELILKNGGRTGLEPVLTFIENYFGKLLQESGLHFLGAQMHLKSAVTSTISR